MSTFIQIALMALVGMSSDAKPMALTPDTISEHRLHLRCTVVEQRSTANRDAAKPDGLATVHLRFGTLPGASGEELESIKDIRLVVRNQEGVVIEVPVQVVVDPGNRVHLYVKFSAQPDSVPMMQLKFEQNDHKFSVDLKPFIETTR